MSVSYVCTARLEEPCVLSATGDAWFSYHLQNIYYAPKPVLYEIYGTWVPSDALCNFIISSPQLLAYKNVHHLCLFHALI